jgi:hypothetical protein
MRAAALHQRPAFQPRYRRGPSLMSGKPPINRPAPGLAPRGRGSELNNDYWRDSLGFLRAAEQGRATPSLFDVLGLADGDDVAEVAA